MTPISLLASALLTFNVNPAYQCDTYRWYLENTNPFVVHQIYQNGVSNSVLNETAGSVDSSIRKAWATQSTAEDVTVVVIGSFNNSQHTFECAEVVRSCVSNRCVNVIEFTDTNRNIEFLSGTIQKAVDLNPDIICMPLSNGSKYDSWFNAISNGMLKGIPFICAAPNVDAEVTSDYPVLWRGDLTNLLIVSGQRIDDAPIFAWSKTLVDINAPARRMQLTDTTFGSGNSYAAAIVTGIGALVIAKHDRAELLTRLVGGVDVKESYANKSISGGTINAVKALWQPTLYLEKTNVSGQAKWYIWGTNGPMRFTIQMILDLNQPDTWFTPLSIDFNDNGKTSLLVPASQPKAYFRGKLIRTR